MAIRFDCICGHHLKARDEMAGRRTMCPACGAPVGVPSLQPTHRGAMPGSLRRSTVQHGTLPMTPYSRPCHRTDERETAGVQPAADHTMNPPGRVARRRDAVRSVRLVTLRERRRAAWRKPRVWDLETRWYQCLKYPLHELPMLLSLAAALAIASGVTLLLLPRVLQGNFNTVAISPLIIPVLLWSLVPLLVLGYACQFLSRVAAYAVAGEVKYIGLPDLDPGPPLRTFGRWAGCFLGGPALLSWAALCYWLNCGTVALLDRMILAELLIPATGYWVFAVLLASPTEHLADANPLRVIVAMHRLGSRTLTVAALGAAVLGVHLWLGMFAIEELHRNPTWGFVPLGACWLSALYCGAFVLRLAGLWHHHALRHVPRETTPRWAIPGLTFVQTPGAAH